MPSENVQSRGEIDERTLGSKVFLTMSFELDFKNTKCSEIGCGREPRLRKGVSSGVSLRYKSEETFGAPVGSGIS